MMQCAQDDPTYRLADLGTEFLDETGLIFEEWPLPADYT